ncbi:hypothetical protein [Streptomyces sp. enrichment culture]|uniref:hypothetical protein n=1 Tax=Streptomyces sp. enrichment culture TaxID=1795815 RepID=UPI003F54D885
MALIEDFQRVPSDAQKVHGPVTCGYRAFTIDGRRILQLDTYGSTDRAIPNKISQSIQLDAAGARALIDIITDAFPDIVH